MNHIANINIELKEMSLPSSRGFGDAYIRSLALLRLQKAAEVSDEVYCAMVEAAGIPSNALHDADMIISFRNLARLVEMLAVKTSKPCLGLEWAKVSAPEFPNIGPIVFLSKFSTCLGDWLQMSLRYWKHHTNATSFQFIEKPGSDRVVMRLVALPDAYPTRHWSMDGLPLRACLPVRDRDGRIDTRC